MFFILIYKIIKHKNKDNNSSGEELRKNGK